MTEPQRIVRELLLEAALDGDPSVERVKITRIELAPRQAAGLHLHPCPVVGLVTGGTIRFQVVGGAESILHAGDAFFEPANAHIAHFDNASETEPATFVAFYLLAPGEDRLIEMLER